MTSVSSIGGSGGQMGPPDYIKAQLDKYGLQPQGSLAADQAAIAAARAQQQANNQQGEKGQAGKPQGKPPGPPPDILAQLMALGLQPQGSKEADQAAISNAQSQNAQGNKLNFMA